MTKPPQEQSTISSEEIRLAEGLVVLLRHWRVVLGLPAAALVVALFFFLLLPPRFDAETAFVPETSSGGALPASLAGLAGQFGIGLSGEGSQGSQFYAKVATNPETLNRLLLTRFEDPNGEGGSDSVQLLRLLGADGDNLADSLSDGRQILIDHVSIRVDRPTSIVTLRVQDQHSQLAADIANTLVTYLDEFNAETRQSQARERRRFVEARLSEAERSLEAAENATRAFLERNRLYDQSPQLVFQRDRLQRQVAMRQEVAITLRREYESARIAEVNDTPVITVIYPAHPPVHRSLRLAKLLVVIALVLGLVAGLVGALTVEYLARARDRADPYVLQLLEMCAAALARARRLLGGRRQQT